MPDVDSWGWNTPGLWQARPGCRQDSADWDSWGWNTPGIWQDMPARWQDRPARWQDRPGWWQWPKTDFAFWSPEIATAMKAWVAFPSLSLLQDDGLEVFARRSKNAAARAESLPDVLLSHLPPDPRELATGSRLATGAFLAGGHSLLRCPASAVILSSISMAWFCRLNPACGVSMFHGMWSMSIRRR